MLFIAWQPARSRSVSGGLKKGASGAWDAVDLISRAVVVGKHDDRLEPMESHELKPVSADRLGQLQGVEWLFNFIKKYPRVLDMRADSADKLFDGLIDTHVHANPDSLGNRSQDLVDVAIDYARRHARAILHKDHHYSTVGVAQVTQRFVDHLVESGRLENRIEVYGGVPLAYTTDPKFVATAARSPFMKMIFMNAIYGEILVDGNRVLPAVEEIIRVAVDNRIPITVCPPNHSSKYGGAEDYPIVATLVECMAKHQAKVLLDQPISAYTIEQIQQLASCGAYVGIFCYPTIPDVIKAPVTDPELTRELIDAVTPDRCILGSDKGYVLEPDAIQAMRLLLRLLMAWGFSEAQIRTMAADNAAKLLFE